MELCDGRATEVNSQLSYGYMYVSCNAVPSCEFYITPNEGSFTTHSC